MSQAPTDPPDPPQRQFKGVWLCAAILDNEELSPAEKILIAEIDSLTHPEKACYASNEFLARRMHLSEAHMRDTLAELTSGGYLVRLAFTGRVTLRCVHPALSSNAPCVQGLIEKYDVKLQKDVPHKKKTAKSPDSSYRKNPIPKDSYRKNPTPGSSPRENPTAGIADCRPQPSEISDTKTTTTENRKDNNNPPAAGVPCAPKPKSQQVVVVSSLKEGSEEEPWRIEQLQAELTEAFGLEGHQIEMVQVYAEREGLRYIEEKATLTRLKAKDNPARYFELAMKRNWPLPVKLAKKCKSPSHSPLSPPPDEPAPEPITPEQQQASDAARRALLDSLRNPSKSPEAQAKKSAAEARYERLKRRWDEANLEERTRWLEQADPIIRKHFRVDGPLPMRALWSAVIPDPDGETPHTEDRAPQAATGSLSPQQLEGAAA